LALCQRYFTRFNTDGVGTSGIATGFQASTTTSVYNINFPVQMRAEPTMTSANLSCSDQVNFGAAATLNSASCGYLMANIVFTHASNGAQFRPSTLFVLDNTTGHLSLSAEL
jgi:hypothetical protein